MKALGKDIKEFWLHHWPAGMFAEETDESLLNKKGNPALENAAEYDLSRFGYLLSEDQASETKEGTFEAHFLKWQKQRTLTSIVVTVPKDKLAETIKLLAGLGLTAVTA